MPNISWSAAGYVQSLGLKSAESAKFRLILLLTEWFKNYLGKIYWIKYKPCVSLPQECARVRLVMQKMF